MTLEIVHIPPERIASLKKMDDLISEIEILQEQPRNPSRDEVLEEQKRLASHAYNFATDLNREKDMHAVAVLRLEQRGLLQGINEVQLQRFDNMIMAINIKYPTKK